MDRVLITKYISELPTDYNQSVQNVEGRLQYFIDDVMFANISIVPNHLKGTEEDIESIAKNYFSQYVVRKFDNIDFFMAYATYVLSN